MVKNRLFTKEKIAVAPRIDVCFLRLSLPCCPSFRTKKEIKLCQSFNFFVFNILRLPFPGQIVKMLQVYDSKY